VQSFLSLADARQKIAAWCLDDNNHRPHSALGNLAPENSHEQAGVQNSVEDPDFLTAGGSENGRGSGGLVITRSKGCKSQMTASTTQWCLKTQ
jgi:hypothetical protein